MIIIDYSKDGQPVSDFNLEEYCMTLVKNLESGRGNGVVTIKTSTSNIVWCIKALVAEEKIDNSKVTLTFEGSRVDMNKYGAIQDWPKGYLMLEPNFAERASTAAVRRAKADRIID